MKQISQWLSSVGAEKAISAVEANVVYLKRRLCIAHKFSCTQVTSGSDLCDLTKASIKESWKFCTVGQRFFFLSFFLSLVDLMEIFNMR